MDTLVHEIGQRLSSGEVAQVTLITNKRLQFRVGADSFSIAMRRLMSYRPIGRQFRSISTETNHPLSQEFNEPTFELYIYSAPGEIGAYLSALRECSQRVTHRNLRRFTGHLRSLHEFLKAGQGLLLKGPKSLVEAAHQVSTEHGVAGSFIDVDGARFPKQMLLIDKSYLIADRFTFRRVDHESSEASTLTQ